MSVTGRPTGLVGLSETNTVPEQKGGRRPEPIVVWVSSTVAAGRLPTGSRPGFRYMFFKIILVLVIGFPSLELTVIPT